MIVDDLDVVSIVADPTEADSELVVDANAVLTEPIASELLEAIGWRDFQVDESRGCIEHREFAQCGSLEVWRKPPHLPALKEALRVVVAEAANHGT